MCGTSEVAARKSEMKPCNSDLHHDRSLRDTLAKFASCLRVDAAFNE